MPTCLQYILYYTWQEQLTVFNVSVYYLIGEGELAALDKDLLKRIEDIEKLDEDTKKHLFFLIDNVIENYKIKKAFSK